ETVQQFLERYINRARAADIDLKVENETVAKALFDLLPPSVTRNTPRDEKRPLKVAEAVRNYRGVPEDSVLPLVYCPCCSNAGKFICASDKCGFYSSSAATIKRLGESKRKNDDDDPGTSKLNAKKLKEEREKKFDQAYKDKKCVDCGDDWQVGHMCATRAARLEKKKGRFESVQVKTLEDHDYLFGALNEFQEMLFQEIAVPKGISKGPCTLLEVNGKKVVAIVDTMASVSFVNDKMVEQLSLETLKLAKPMEVMMANQSNEWVTDRTLPARIESHDGRAFDFAFNVFPTEHGMVLGQDVLPKLGIFIGNLNALEWDSTEKSLANVADDSLEGRSAQGNLVDVVDSQVGKVANCNQDELEELSDEELFEKVDVSLNKGGMEKYQWLLKEVSKRFELFYFKNELARNRAIKEFCNHPDAVIEIDTKDAKPVNIRQYPIPMLLRPKVSESIQDWIKEGIVRKHNENTGWNLPLLVVPKFNVSKDIKGWRTCVDPRIINQLIPSVAYPLPTVDEIFQKMGGKRWFTKIDLWKGFHQMLMALEDQLKTSFTWEGQSYCFITAPMGFKHVPAVFQRVIRRILQEFDAFAINYVDDIIVFSDSLEEHVEHVRQVLEKLNSFNLRVNFEKLEFVRREIIILGYLISERGVEVCKEKVLSMEHWSIPKTGNQLEKHLGFFNYFRSCIPAYSTLFAPLEKLRKAPVIEWCDDFQRIYDQAKEILMLGLTLSYPDFNRPFYVGTDASKTGIAAVLYQEGDDGQREQRRYIRLASRALSSSESHYSATKRELLAIVFALEKFREYLYGLKFVLKTDHKPLIYLRTQKKLNDMQLGWLTLLMEFDFSIEYLPGIQNILPDAISRLYPGEEKEDGERETFFYEVGSKAVESSSELEEVLLETAEFENSVLVVDKQKQQELLQFSHAKGHFGSTHMVKDILEAGWHWPGLRKNCQDVVSSCINCQRFNIGKHGFHPVRNHEARLPLDKVAIDAKEMVKSKYGN
ncbi:MAG: hypothetical protein RLZZ74_3167, partial [Cyanobacteriota bacterium]